MLAVSTREDAEKKKQTSPTQSAAIGGVCSERGAMQCADAGPHLVCLDGKWEPITCRDACRVIARRWSCDEPAVGIGLPCLEAGSTACSDDRSSLLKCTNGRFELDSRCHEGFSCHTASSHEARCALNVDGSTSVRPIAAEQFEARNRRPGGAGCEPAALRLIKKMASCGVNVSGFTADTFCARFNASAMRYMATLSCDEITRSLASSSE